MNINKKLFILSLISVTLFSCSKGETVSTTTSSEVSSIQESSAEEELTNEERLHNAYLDVIETKQENLRPLVSLTQDDEKVIWNETKDKVLLFTFHRFPSSYPDGEEITFTWGESWLCSLLEYKNWYLENKNNIEDELLRTKQVLGMSHESRNTYITSMWLDPNDIYRPAYIKDATKQMETSFPEGESQEYKDWFTNQYYYSYDVSKLPWTRLGYTYDWSKEAKDKYGLTEFIAWKGTTATVEKTLTVSEYLATFNN